MTFRLKWPERRERPRANGTRIAKIEDVTYSYLREKEIASVAEPTTPAYERGAAILDRGNTAHLEPSKKGVRCEDLLFVNLDCAIRLYAERNPIATETL